MRRSEGAKRTVSEPKLRIAAVLPVVIALVTCLVAESSHSQDGPCYAHTGPVVISGIRVIDGLGGEPAENQDIVIFDAKIAAMGPSGSLDAPRDALKIDGSGMTAMPGLIDMHIHLKGGWTGGNAMPEKYTAGQTDPEVQQTLSAFLYSGVTTVFDVGNPTVWAATQRKRIESGELIGPRFFTTGMPFSQDPSGWDGAVRAETVGEPDPSLLSSKVTTPDPAELGKLLDFYVENDIEIISSIRGRRRWERHFFIGRRKSVG